MSEKILYYLGAGASANALPLSKSIWGENIMLGDGPLKPGLAFELKNLRHTTPIYNLIQDQEKSEKGLLTIIIENCEKLGEKADEFGDVDTYAKYLKVIGATKELNSVKHTLSQYFVIKQLILDARDSRYIPWLVGMMERSLFPENVKVLSWNYDFQLELACEFLNLKGEDISFSGSSFVYTPSSLNYYPNLDPTYSDFDRLSLIHLNGIAGLGERGRNETVSIFQDKYRHSTKDILSFLNNTTIQNKLHFAWEKSIYHDRLMEYVHRMTVGTTILVVIGYSFPFYNREVDKQIFASLINNDNTLKKIYYQDPILDGKQLINQFQLQKDFDIEHISGIENFHIPFEY